MSRRKQSRIKPTQAPPALATAPEQSAALHPRYRFTARQIILFVIILVFVIFEISVIANFSSGGSIRWKKELVEINRIYGEGKYQEAARRMTAFGDKWPGSKSTFDWNRKMGLYHAAAGDWKTAAEYYLRAIDINPKAPKIHAFAGEALWKAGEKDRAIEVLQKEVTDIKRAIGDHDRANFYLGLSLEEEGRYPEAFQHFQSISDRGTWQKQLDELYAKVDRDLIEPAREKARNMPKDAIP